MSAPDPNIAPPAPGSTEVMPGASAASAVTVELLSSDEYSKFMLQTRNEMLPVLRGLVDHVAQVTMFFNEGKDMVLTSVISFDNDKLYLDFGASPDMNRKALEAEKLFCITQLEKVKIQFLLRGLTRVEFEGSPAFSAAMPDSMLRLQRREYFRLSMPVTRPLRCVTSAILPDGSRLAIDAAVADISGGGLGLVQLPLTTPIEPGMELQNCRIELPEVGIITGTLRICSVMESINRNGTKTKRAGCEFVKLAGPMLTLVQRYIIKVERERKARETGMG